MAESAAERIENLDLDKVEDGAGDNGGKSEAKSSDDSKGADSGDSKDTSGRQDKVGDGARPEGDGAGDTGSEGGDADESDDDEGYAADELEGDEDDEEEPTPQQSSDLSPELQYIVNNLPNLQVRGRTKPEGDIRTFTIKAAGQLPDTFEFATKREELIFTQQLAAQELKAQQLQGTYQQDQQKQQATKYSEQENTDIRSDIGDLQREGLLPKFKYAPNDKKFDNDPAVAAAQDVMDYMNERNNDYAKQNKLYRISFRDAYEQVAKREADKQAATRQSREDRERKTVSRQLAGAGSAPSNSVQRARPARSTEELMERINMLDF